MIQVTLPTHLRTLAQVTGPVALQVGAPVTQRAILDALEAAYPALRGTIRDMATQERRAFIRYFACGEDLSHESPDAIVPADVIAGKQPFRIIGALAGG
ncbi:MAG: MoaD/ThiS family protein [Anaerolineaceae bacterium]|nr:MoaD/ThiS family protein [Anaerolineaceae bacterium]